MIRNFFFLCSVGFFLFPHIAIAQMNTHLLTKKERIEKMINKQTPSTAIRKRQYVYPYIKQIQSGRSTYYRDRFRKINRNTAKFHSQVTSSKKNQGFYRPYSHTNRLKLKYYPSIERRHYRSLFAAERKK